ncbi:MAG TPA: hypothetical protein VHX39_37565, partial [Acetobacteraceae bacterium]|nr:hypothetical protein [Acetobacteraceae bacterium]
MRIPVVLAVLLSTAALAAGQTTTPWNYYGKTGPLGWGKLDPAYRLCSQGHEQSPIDVHGAHLNKALQPIEFHYMAGPVRLENT